MKKTIIKLSLSLISLNAYSQSVERRLLTMEKSYNPENIMVIHTQTDRDCKFVASQKNNDKNYLEFYWIMDNGRSIKEVHSKIRNEIQDRLRFKGINSTRDSFRIQMNDLNELRHDLTDISMEITSEVVGGKCGVKSIMTLGASSRYRKMNLKRTYCDVSKNFVGIPNGCHYLELEGSDIDSGEIFKVRFRKK